MKVAAHTLGCKLNYAETSHLLRQFAEAGHTVVGFHERADAYIINTCTVTAAAEKKGRNAIRQALGLNPAAVVAVTGCFAQNSEEQAAAIEGVSLIVGNDQKQNLLHLVEARWANPSAETVVLNGEPKSFRPIFSGGDRTRTFFKIQDGCDYYCAYCAIPFARGRSRSATIAETVAAARRIAATGTREVVLTGVNTGTFGLHHGERFEDLLRQLDRVEGILRYRISSIEPNLITDEIIDFAAQSRAFLPHFHIPLQSGSDKVLRLMRRRYDTVLYAQRVEHIKRVMPDACIAADVITGFNGEDEEAFGQSKAYIDSLPISYLHVFPYSDRPGTAALRMGEKVPVAIRKERSAELHLLSDEKRRAFVAGQKGKCRSVLWEHTPHPAAGGTLMQGWTDNYIRLQQPFDESQIGTIGRCTLSDSTIVENFATEE